MTPEAANTASPPALLAKFSSLVCATALSTPNPRSATKAIM